MKLKIIPDPNAPTKRFILADENGVPLPKQRGLVFRDSYDGVSEVEVRFLVDGDSIAIANTKHLDAGELTEVVANSLEEKAQRRGGSLWPGSL